MTRRLLLLVFITLTILICGINSHDHSHDHGHGHGHGHSHEHGHGHGHAHEEPPSFKYSREANELHHGHSHSHEEETVTYAPPHYNEGSDDDDDDDKTVAPFSVMSWAILSTIGISLAPVVILFFIPVSNSPQHQSFLKILLSFASGGLLGDAFLHLIPHAMSSYGSNEGHGHGHGHSHSHSHNHSADIQVGLYILLGIFLFLIVEKLVRHVKGHGHGHSHAHPHEVNAPTGKDDDDDVDDKKKEKKSPKKSKPKTEVIVPVTNMKISGYLNLFADGLHNFTDGLAIGSSYLLGRNLGAITTLAIFFHEIPHEIGDYAILIQNGCSRKKAIFLQLTTAIGALLGCLISLLFHSSGTELWATQTFLPITAGGFIYIATVSVIPELLETNSGFKQSVLEMIALIVGVAIMVLVTIFE